MPLEGMGTKLYFAPQGGDRVAIGCLKRIGALTPTRGEWDVTTLDAPLGAREFLPGQMDPGELELEGFLHPEDAGQRVLRDAFSGGEMGTGQVVFSDGGGAQFRAFVKKLAFGGAGVDGAVGFRAVLRLCGNVAFLPGPQAAAQSEESEEGFAT